MAVVSSQVAWVLLKIILFWKPMQDLVITFSLPTNFALSMLALSYLYCLPTFERKCAK
jgi:hypothetical protein